MQGGYPDVRRIPLAGALLCMGATWFILAITIAESLTPGYSVSNEAVSGLGSPYFSGICNDVPRCVSPIQPASAVFVSSVFLNGVLEAYSGFLMWKAAAHRRFALSIVVVGVGWIFVGFSYLPFYLGSSAAGVAEAALALHVTGALMFFLVTPFAAISTYRLTRGPIRFFSVILGAFSLTSFLITFPLLASGNPTALGPGGLERMIIYPGQIWQIGFGASILRGWD